MAEETTEQETTATDSDKTVEQETTESRGRPSKAEIALREKEEEMERMRNRIHELNKENEKHRHNYKPWKEIESELGLTPDEIKQWKEDQKEQERKAAEKAQDWEKLKESWLQEFSTKEQTWQEKLQEKDQMLQEMQSTVENFLIDSQIKEAIIKNGGDELTLDVLTDKVKQRSKVERDETTGKYKAFALDDEGKPLDFNSVVASMKNDKMYSKLFPSPESSGGGSGKGAETNNAERGSKKAPKKDWSEMSPLEKAEAIREYGSIAEYRAAMPK